MQPLKIVSRFLMWLQVQVLNGRRNLPTLIMKQQQVRPHHLIQQLLPMQLLLQHIIVRKEVQHRQHVLIMVTMEAIHAVNGMMLKIWGVAQATMKWPQALNVIHM